jgi:hypothetical protein
MANLNVIPQLISILHSHYLSRDILNKILGLYAFLMYHYPSNANEEISYTISSVLCSKSSFRKEVL